jgi:hypothetical protein
MIFTELSRSHEKFDSQAWTPSALPLLFIVLGIVYILIPVSTPVPQVLSLKSLSKEQLQLIPGVGPVLAEELLNLQGAPLRSCRGVGEYRERQLRRFIKQP